MFRRVARKSMPSWAHRRSARLHRPQRSHRLGSLGLAEEAIDELIEKSRIQEQLADEVEQKLKREQHISLLGHDLRTPLAAALSCAELISQKPDDPKLCRFMASQISRSIIRADRMIQDLLDASRIRSGAVLPIEPSPCALSEPVRTAYEELRQIHGERFQLEIACECRGYWDSDAIRRGVENLVNNAVKYGSLDTRITIRLSQSEDSAVLSVHNFGPPLSMEDQSRIFSWFGRYAKGDQQRSEGWGLGLFLVKGIAEAHGGIVKFSSSESDGTTFTLELPLKPRQSP